MAKSRKPSTSSVKQGKTTIFDVASQAGVSIKTVSRVVNQEANVSEKTRTKVMEAIAALQYRPNTAARGLSSKRSYVIGLIYENADEFSYMKRVLDGALTVCEDQGYTLLLRPLTLPAEDLIGQIRNFAEQASVDGVLLPPPLADVEGVCELMAEMDIPFASITPKDSPNPSSGGSLSVYCDDDKASQALTEFLIEQGHTRIGFIKGHPDHRASDERFRGYRQALKDKGLPYSASLVRQGYFTFESGQAAAEKLLNLPSPPTAIVACSDDMAAGVAFQARDQGFEIPADLSLVGYDDTPVAEHMWPPLTTVRQPIVGMAQAATRRLIQMLRGEPQEELNEPFSCEIIIRRSTQSL